MRLKCAGKRSKVGNKSKQSLRPPDLIQCCLFEDGVIVSGSCVFDSAAFKASVIRLSKTSGPATLESGLDRNSVSFVFAKAYLRRHPRHKDMRYPLGLQFVKDRGIPK